MGGLTAHFSTSKFLMCFYKHVVSSLVIDRKVDPNMRVKLTGGTLGHGLSPMYLRDR